MANGNTNTADVMFSTLLIWFTEFFMDRPMCVEGRDGSTCPNMPW